MEEKSSLPLHNYGLIFKISLRAPDFIYIASSQIVNLTWNVIHWQDEATLQFRRRLLTASCCLMRT